MFKLYTTKNERVYEKVKEVCQIDCEIKRTENGKPYFEGDPVFFSVSHTGETALIAVCDRAVGVDAEIIKQRDFNAILKRFTAREQDEIALDTLAFLKNWTAKEAYIKLLGGTLAEDLKRLEYFDGVLCCDGIKADCTLFCAVSDGLVYTVCVADGNSEIN